MGFQLWSLPAVRTAAILGFALLAPAALPAGGGERQPPQLRRRAAQAEPLLSGRWCPLLCAPDAAAPVITAVEPGAPMRVLRRWGERWWQVDVPTATGRRRGWLNA